MKTIKLRENFSEIVRKSSGNKNGYLYFSSNYKYIIIRTETKGQMMFFIISISVLFLIHLYIGIRIINPFDFSPMWKYLSFGVLFIMFLSPFLLFWFRTNGINKSLESLVGWIGYTWLGFASLIFLLVLFRDLGWTLGTSVQKVYQLFSQSDSGTNEVTTFNSERRQFLIQSMNFGLLGLSAIGTGYGLFEARRRAAIVNIDIPLKNLPDAFNGFRIVQFSDLHVGPTIRNGFVKTIAKQIEQLQGDMIVFTGDLVDGSVESLKNDVAPLKSLQAAFGKFFITGNHEYYSGALPWCDEAKNLGFDVLINENRTISKGDAKIVLAGVTDISGGSFVSEHKSDPAKALGNTDSNFTKILLAHQPRSIFEAAKVGYDLQLSGHTHGGQLIPWQYLTRLAQPYMWGLHKYENTWIYVNQGTGYWGPPLRIGARSEITILHLIKESDKIT
ncbi:metallophosphoesterase [Calditrichota bacterium]